MRLLVFLWAGLALAQVAEDPQVSQARLEVVRVQAMVDAGALPRVQLEKAKEALADAEDGALLRKDIFTQDLTEAQADEMVAAASRQFERRKKAFDETKKLVDAGVAPQRSLSDVLEKLEFARKDCELVDRRAKLVRELQQMAEAEEALQPRLAHGASTPYSVAQRFDGNGVFTPKIFAAVESAFAARFGHALPVSANGQTAVHTAMGFDHRGRVDVALNPDQVEGVWLRDYLVKHNIPFFAFRQAVPGKATGAHIHLGPMSTRIAAGG